MSFPEKNEIDFTRINKHGQSIQLGCSFLQNEKTDSFTWLFQTFKEAMGGNPPCIITDQDVAMTATISIVFPESTHRNYRWHIMENVKKKMGFFYGKKYLCAYFNDCADNSYNIEEFEIKWQAVLDKHGLHGDE
jgi:hypothetical protein